MNKYLKNYMFWEALSGLITLLYLTLFFITVLTGQYVYIFVGLTLILLLPICFIFKIKNAFKIATHKKDDANE